MSFVFPGRAIGRSVGVPWIDAIIAAKRSLHALGDYHNFCATEGINIAKKHYRNF
jgi:hypothetical protein